MYMPFTYFSFVLKNRKIKFKEALPSDWDGAQLLLIFANCCAVPFL